MINLSQNNTQVSQLFRTPEIQLLTESVNWEISFLQDQLYLICKVV